MLWGEHQGRVLGMHGLGRSLGWNQACVLSRESLRFLRLGTEGETMAREELKGLSLESLCWLRVWISFREDPVCGYLWGRPGGRGGRPLRPEQSGNRWLAHSAVNVALSWSHWILT